MAKVWVSTEVEVDMSEFSDEDIQEEASDRGISGFSSNEDELTEMFYAFKLGRDDRAMEIARYIAQEHTGMIL